MRVVVAHGRARERRRFARVLAEAGHDVTECDCADDALDRCREWAPDVARASTSAAGDGAARDDQARSRRLPHRGRCSSSGRRAAGRRAPTRRCAAACRTSSSSRSHDAELVTRVQAAGRTKGLQEEIVAQAERLEALLFEDPLTGLSNRRFILTQLARHGQRRPPPRPAADGRDHRHRPLQAVNDTHGHAEGDRVLAAVAHAMREHLRAEDQLGRLGGEEFLALLPETDAPRPPTRRPRSCAPSVRRQVGP